MNERMIVEGISCEHLIEQHGTAVDRIDVEFRDIRSHKDLEVGMKGIC